MKQSQAQDIVTRLLARAAEVRYGSVSVTANLHDGRVVALSYSTTEQTREPKETRSEDLGMRNGKVASNTHVNLN